MLKHTVYLLSFGAGLTVAQGSMVTLDEPSLGFEHGEVVTNQIPGLIISATGGIGQVQIFDTDLDDGPPSASDDDLKSPFEGGTLKDQLLGNALIIQENNGEPDDATKGTITLDYATPIASFAFTFVDIENPKKAEVELHGANGGSSTIGFETFASDFGAEWGDNSANSAGPLFLSGELIDMVVFNFKTSVAIPSFTAPQEFSIVSPIPEPNEIIAGTASIGMLSLVAWRRFKQRS